MTDIKTTGRFCVQCPPSVYYIPDFITKEEEEYLTNNVYAAPKPKWTQLSNRRLQNWGGLPHPKGMVCEELPQWLQKYAKTIAELGTFEDKIPNHVLVNEYKAGQGIMPHEDGNLFYPTVSTISLGSHTLLDFYYHLQDHSSQENEHIQSLTSFEDRYFMSLLLQPRSLVLVQSDMYKLHLHGIAERTEDHITESVSNLDFCPGVNLGDVLKRGTRISLTIRYVPKVLKVKLMLGKKR
ncbi:alpha-ketoglutarate-dependent dioxygenase alkB homolog 6-like isoform X2 [Gigantopelta aegis]|uniref:alpha-ketoglutarate-dependent dioxygenase alkB homolog 6-like isoform X2 n=1 Tax=Gigantopelta aegis TaxID=1735272 RepID=UPI001B887E7D|nr:alpha-ketoglutarate-dependent dioxygenase alkB homolog 6-like isoform X2 [Gigantopelta aegis]